MAFMVDGRRAHPTTSFPQQACLPGPIAPDSAMPARSGASSSSMNTAASFTSSWLDGSPSRQSPNRNGVRTPRGSIVREPHDSPSRQMQIEFNMMLSRSDRDFNERLDQAAAERAKIHNEQLTKAAQEHQRIQEGAKLEIQRLLLEQEQEKRQREEAQRREIERLNQEKARQEAEAQRQRLEAKRREEEAARQALEHQKRIQEADARVKAQKDQEDAQRRHRQEEERKAQEAAAAAEKARSQPLAPIASQVPPASTAPTSIATAQSAVTSAPAAGVEELHQRFLELHTRMKKWRIEFKKVHQKPGQPLKELLSKIRSTLRIKIGQCTKERSKSVTNIKAIREIFDEALNTTGPTVDIRPFIISHQIPPLANEAEAHVPGVFLYAWIFFEKFLIKQWGQEAANEEDLVIQELGLIAASMYADPRYMWKGVVPYTDTFLAKMHRVCPILFGIRGNTTNNRAGLGLQRYVNSDQAQNEYLQFMSGYGAGYAAVSLRQFSGKNPTIPMSEYWRAVASICNTPPNDLYAGHFMVLKGLLRGCGHRFLVFYGQPAKAVLRRATMELPNRALKNRPSVMEAAELVKVLPDVWRVDKDKPFDISR